MSGSSKRNSSNSDPGLWFPLLKGFFQRGSSRSGQDTGLEDSNPSHKNLSLKALSAFQAERIISSWLLSMLQKKRQGDIKYKSHAKKHTHFLLRALSSPSLPVRRLAATIILDATNPMTLVRMNMSKPKPLPNIVDPAGRIRLRDMFWTFARKDIEDMISYATPTDDNLNLYCPSHDGVIQIFGVLAHLIFDDDGAWYAYSYYFHREDDTRISPCCAIEHFISSGGLRWITSSLVRLISTLLREEGYTGWGRSSSTDTSYTEAVQLRIILLVDLCNRLFMHVVLHPIQFPHGYWQSMLEHSYSENQLESERNKLISRIEKKRKDARVRTLYSAFHVLWSSRIPAVRVDSSYNNSGSSLSPLACLVAVYSVLRTDDDLNPVMNATTTNISAGFIERNNAINQDADRSCFKNYFEVPIVPQRLEGINQALDCLQKMIDPTGNVFFTAATYPPTKIDSVSKTQSNVGNSESTNLNLQEATEHRVTKKRSRSISSSSDNLPSKKMNQEADEEISNGIREESEPAMTSTLLAEIEERSHLLQSDLSTQKKNQEVMESSGICGEEEEEVHDEEYGNEDGMIDVDDEADEESENDECSDYDPSELAGCIGFDATEGDLKVVGNQSKAEKLSVSESSILIIPKAEREQSLIRASMELLHAHYGYRKDRKVRKVNVDWRAMSSSNQDQSQPDLNKISGSGLTFIMAPPLLTVSAEQYIIGTICNIVKPPPKPFKMKIVMKRQPSQEEFFRGSLSKNPINLESLSSKSEDCDDEPRVRDLRLHIARDLKMEDSAELLEMLVGNKILGLGLKLRVVCQVVWKKHILDKAESSNAGFSSSFLPSSLSNRRADSAPGSSLSFNSFNDNDALKLEAMTLPPMIVTYRLIGVDGEAIEERVEDGDLIDPEAPCETQASNEENEKLLEKEYGLTKIVTDQRGVQMLLKSTESYLTFCTQSIRRDNITRKHHPEVRNTARDLFLKSKLCPSLVLLRHCARLKDNRAKMFKSRAPTKLLRMLLDLLSCMEESRSPFDIANAESPCPVAMGLQELIEALSSVIAEDIVVFNGESKCLSEEEDDGSLQLLLSSLRTTMLSAPLRAVVSKLLPYLTYGQLQLSRDLASDLVLNVRLEKLGSNNLVESNMMLMDTFVDCAIHLPPTPLFHPLRMELLRQNFVVNLIGFVELLIPDEAPHWCPALVANKHKVEIGEKKLNEEKWRIYFDRQGLTSALRMLIGLATNHHPTQLRLGGFTESSTEDSTAILPNNSFLSACHWIESISDFHEITTCGLGIQAETLLDLLSENEQLSTFISDMRSRTRDRKKVIANERRKALMILSSFPSTEGASSESSYLGTNSATKKSPPILSPRNSIAKSSGINEAMLTSERLKPTEIKSKWLLEMESIEDETGLTCVVCQEGRKVQPKELLGLYGYAKKVVLNSKSNTSSIDGTDLLCSLPQSLPSALLNVPYAKSLFDSVTLSLDRMSSSKRDKTMPKNDRTLFSFDRVFSSSSSFTSTVSAGNAIHCTCHLKARVADKNNSKAAKSEWEGATLRNSRINCNLILPLISSSVSDVPKYMIDSCIEEYTRQLVVITGSQPKSTLWLILFDIRFLLLRIACGESVTQDCGGGSLRSNALILFYMLMMGNALKEKEADAYIHASALPSALILSRLILQSKDIGMEPKVQPNIAEATPTAAIACILFQNGDKSNFWLTHRDIFCSCFIFLSGYRHSLGIEGSGCESSRSSNPTTRRLRSTSFHDWESECHKGKSDNLMTKFKPFLSKRSTCLLEQYANALRPMITLFILLDNLAQIFTVGMNDDVIDQSSIMIGDIFDSCQRAQNLDTLLNLGNIPMDKRRILETFNEGLSSTKKK